MSAENHDVAVAMIVDKVTAGLDGEGFILIGTLAPLGFCDLHRVNHHVAGDKSTVLTTIERYAAMTRGMAGSGY